jgi:hypothetical protein
MAREYRILESERSLTHQRPRNMDPTNPPPAKPFRAGSDEARSTRARTWNIITPHPDTLPSASTGTDINATLHADHSELNLHNTPTKS